MSQKSKKKLGIAIDEGLPLNSFFKTEKEAMSAMAIKFLVHYYKYIYVNRNGDLVGTNVKLGRYVIRTDKVKYGYYLSESNTDL